MLNSSSRRRNYCGSFAKFSFPIHSRPGHVLPTATSCVCIKYVRCENWRDILYMFYKSLDRKGLNEFCSIIISREKEDNIWRSKHSYFFSIGKRELYYCENMFCICSGKEIQNCWSILSIYGHYLILCYCNFATTKRKLIKLNGLKYYRVIKII